MDSHSPSALSKQPMSALAFARQAFGREKPHSSTTDWIDILTSSNVEEEAYDGIPELVDSINLQAGGPAEASRALRKKLKHGNAHQQYRALVLLKALVENCGQKFQTTFADGQLTDAIKHLANDPATDKRVRKKLMLVLASWRQQFSSDPSMSLVAGLHKQCGGSARGGVEQVGKDLAGLSLNEDRKRAEKEEAKRKARQEKEEAKERTRPEERRALEQDYQPNRSRHAIFNFEKEKQNILTSIVDASQASSNLVNAIKLFNSKTDSSEYEHIRECFEKTEKAKKVLIRYIRLVENEELIGTLIETNERAMAAVQMYQDFKSHEHDGPDESPHRDVFSDENEISNTRDRDEGADVHLDLEDLNFGPLGGSSSHLPPPIRPSIRSNDDRDRENRGSLSDFSDYESSGDERHVVVKPNAARRPQESDPFADPFAD